MSQNLPYTLDHNGSHNGYYEDSEVDSIDSELFMQYDLSPRERQIVQLRIQDLSNREIEDILGISTSSVKLYLWQTRNKMKPKIPKGYEPLKDILDSDNSY